MEALTPTDVMLMTKHRSSATATTGVALATGLGGGALLLAIAGLWGVNAASQARSRAAEQIAAANSSSIDRAITVGTEANRALASLIDASGNALEGPHWTKAQILSATSALEFPKGTTDCDKYVAFNAAYADFCKKFSEEQIIYIAYLFYFKDEDWKSEGKVWSYMKSNR